MEKTLQLVFRNEESSLFTLALASPKENLTAAEVSAVMDQVLTKNIFQSTGGLLVNKVRARIIARDTEDIVTF